MIEGIVLGIIQGIAEWIPISSEGMIVLAEVNLFGRTGVEEIIRFALFLHLGTFLAALIYFWKEVKQVLLSIFKYCDSTHEERNLLFFLVISTLISGVLGFALLEGIAEFEEVIEASGRGLTALVGLMLLVTAWLQLKKKTDSGRTLADLTTKDSILLGIAQGFSVLPGLSRSGLTVSALLLRKVGDETSLRLSFLMSMPIVLFGNIFLNFSSISNPASLSAVALWGLVFSFIFGLATIHLLLKFARKVNFGLFVGAFGILMLIAAAI